MLNVLSACKAEERGVAIATASDDNTADGKTGSASRHKYQWVTTLGAEEQYGGVLKLQEVFLSEEKEAEGNEMPITINIYYYGKDGSAKKFAQEMASCGIVNDIRAEAGNLRYEYFFPMDDEETVLLIDSWKDQSSLDMHHTSSIMEKIMKLRDKYDLHMKVERYVTDEAGIPKTDQSFIKE